MPPAFIHGQKDPEECVEEDAPMHECTKDTHLDRASELSEAGSSYDADEEATD